MGLYLIDFENVHDMGINGILSLTDQDEVCLFYSSKSEHMSFDTHVNIMQTNARIKYIKLRRSAKNYLDFQLVTHLGYLIGSGAKGPYYIISKDTGYDSVVDYWKDHGVTIYRQPAISYNRNLTTTSGRPGAPKTPPAQLMIQENKKLNTTAIIPLVNVPGGNDTEQKESRAAATEDAADLQEEMRTDAARDAVQDAEVASSLEDPGASLSVSDADAFDRFFVDTKDDAASDSSITEDPSADGEQSRKDAHSSKADAFTAEDSAYDEAEEASSMAEDTLMDDEITLADLLDGNISEKKSGSQSRSKNRRNNGQKNKNSRNKKAAALTEDPGFMEFPFDYTAPENDIEETKISEQDLPFTDETLKEGKKSAKGNSSRKAAGSKKEKTEKSAEASASEPEEETAVKADSLPETYRKRVRTALRGKEIPSAHYSSIYKAIVKSYDKLALNNLLVKTFGSNKGGVVYNLIRDIFTDYNATR